MIGSAVNQEPRGAIEPDRAPAIPGGKALATQRPIDAIVAIGG